MPNNEIQPKCHIMREWNAKRWILNIFMENNVAGTLFKVCSHKGIDNPQETDKGKRDNIKFVIAGENAAKSFETAKKPGL